MTEKWLEVSINETKFDTSEVSAPYFQRDLARKVVILDNSVYASLEVLSVLVHSPVGVYIKFGRRKMFKITDELLDAARERNSYPRRSDRERAVQTRNYDLIDWLEETADYYEQIV